MDGAEKRGGKPPAGGLTVPRSRHPVAASATQPGGGEGAASKPAYIGLNISDKQREYAEAMRVALAREVRC